MSTNWTIRRNFMFAVVAFCMFVISYVLYKQIDTAAADTAVAMAFFTIIGTVGSYVFGATWDDKNKMGFIKNGNPGEF